MSRSLSIVLADHGGLSWAQEQVAQHHYLHRPVDPRCSPVAYLVLDADEQRVGCLMFGRPQASRVNGWYGDVADVEAGRCPLTRWQVINLARIWLDPLIQRGGAQFIENAATQVIALALRHIVSDFLLVHPPCFLDEPYELRECLSYLDVRQHRGTLYRAANFQLIRENARGIQTYAIPLRRLTHTEKCAIEKRAAESSRSRHYRAMRVAALYEQLLLFSM